MKSVNEQRKCTEIAGDKPRYNQKKIGDEITGITTSLSIINESANVTKINTLEP